MRHSPCVLPQHTRFQSGDGSDIAPPPLNRRASRGEHFRPDRSIAYPHIQKCARLTTYDQQRSGRSILRSHTAQYRCPVGPFILLQHSWPLLRKCAYFIAAGCFFVWCFVALRSDFAWDAAEAELLEQAWHLAPGRCIYQGVETPPYAFSLYRPLYIGLIAFPLKFFGLSFLPAKLVSLIAGVSIGYALMRLGKEWNKTGGFWVASFLFLIPAFLCNLLRSHVPANLMRQGVRLPGNADVR
jgi:hypothetical protein